MHIDLFKLLNINVPHWSTGVMSRNGFSDRILSKGDYLSFDRGFLLGLFFIFFFFEGSSIYAIGYILYS